MFNGEPTADDHGNVLYEIRKDPVVGRYMVAARDIQPGEAIFTDSPVAIGKSTQITHHHLFPGVLNIF